MQRTGRIRQNSVSTPSLLSPCQAAVRRKAGWLALTFACLFSSPLHAQLQLGSDLIEFSVGSAFSRSDPKIAVAGGGTPSGGVEFMVVWTEQVGSFPVIAGRRASSSGVPLGPQLNFTSGASSASQPTVAYDSNRDRYLLAWKRTVSLQNSFIASSFLTASGSVISQGPVLTDSEDSPRLQFLPALDRFFLYSREATPSGGDFPRFTRIQPNGFPEREIEFGILVNPLGGFAYDASRDRFLCTWHDLFQPPEQLRGTLVPSSLTNVGSDLTLSVPATAARASVAYDPLADRYLVVRLQSTAVVGRLYDGEGQVAGPPFDIQSIVTSQTGQPVVTRIPGASGFIVAGANASFTWTQQVSSTGELIGNMLPVGLSSPVPFLDIASSPCGQALVTWSQTPIFFGTSTVFGRIVTPEISNTYCTGKVSSQGCTPAISTSGFPNSECDEPFLIRATQLVNQKAGLLFMSNSSPTALPFQGGVLCMFPPLLRSPLQFSNGNPPPDDCSGSFGFDFGAFQASTTLPFAIGDTILCQWWIRDPAASGESKSALSNALEFVLAP